MDVQQLAHQLSGFRLGFDAKRAALNTVGLGNYSRTLITLLDQHLTSKLFLFSPLEFKAEFSSFLNSLSHSLVVIPSKKFLWRDFRINSDFKKHKIDLYHGLSHVLPWGVTIPSVVTMHDLIYLKRPELFSVFDLASYHLRFKTASQKANHIISISEETKEDLIKYFKVPADKITVTYQSCSPLFRKVSISAERKQELLQKYGIGAKKMILSVGTVEKRKNLGNLLKAFAILTPSVKDQYEIVIAGKKTTYANELEQIIKSEKISNSVRLIGPVDHEDLIELYNLAFLFVYPSVVEGFGIPVIEAMQCGVPVLTSNVSSLKEVGGEAAFLVDPLSISSIAENLKAALDSDEKRNEKLGKLDRHLQKFSPAETTKKVLEVYTKVLVSKN